MKVFVTGATGVIGRRVVPRLVEANHHVTAVARSAEKRAALETAGAAAVGVNLFDRDGVARAVAGHDAVINLATHMPGSSLAFLRRAPWRENDRIRREASAILAEAAMSGGAVRFIQESFALVYPDRGEAWIEEDTPLAPVAYNRSIDDAERSAKGFTARGGAGIVLRFAGFYGPDAFTVRDTIRLVRKGWAPFPAPPEGFVSSVSHDDAATAVVAALGAPPGVYNVTDDEPLRRREYFDALAAAIGVAPPRLPPAWMARLIGSLGEMMSRSLRISNRKLREATGWSPRYRSAREGWKATIAEMRL